MANEEKQYLSQEKFDQLKKELKHIKETLLPDLAKRIDDARQMGDLSENAEYHQAREEMSWTQSRVKEIEYILQNSELIKTTTHGTHVVAIGSTVELQMGKITKQFTIVGAQEADPLAGKISNESPLGQALLGKKVGERVSLTVPAGLQTYTILDIVS
ncbi:MAG TPA: transcription elongation factor GreA [Candidatus Magasanikbacteria bacterium]|nr:MAG: transcription elongation factor GreA [Candidatus Magasanikbacteria bacterium RIFCSPLOWO2_02_FULL_47_16]OGH80008.1 MAG: transcription elongation factor GreA [Candidatus Magasanikbacteria bacterium RIFCSPHIGHO2_02_FULL_48_18]OGH82918.1 MAG: transcription elongation factor GreA [Candidatus Magasanikbacteria bacterium RIFCSPLOWO2_12_FULL_47_9b]HAZ28515.1 transcription elongation factor GreA [Candidatus Magasanikbacteria bacterium]